MYTVASPDPDPNHRERGQLPNAILPQRVELGVFTATLKYRC